MSAKKNKKNKKQIKLICNPEAGDPKDPTDRLEQVSQLLIQQGFKVDVALAKPKETATKIARKAVKEGYKLIAVMGGDGTIEAAAQALVGTKVHLGILPGGTENNIVKSLGIPDDLESACKLLAGGKFRKIDVGQIKTKKAGKFYFLEIAAIGLIAEIFPAAKDIGKGQLLGNIGQVLNQVVRYEMPKMTVKINGQSQVKVISSLVTVSGTPSFGQAFLVAPNAVWDDGCLDVNLYANMTKTQILAYFAAVSKQGKSGETRIQRYQARKITISATPKQVIMADGVMLGKGKVKIKVCRKALRVIAGLPPAPKDEEEITKIRLPEPIAPAPKVNKEEPAK